MLVIRIGASPVVAAIALGVLLGACSSSACPTNGQAIPSGCATDLIKGLRLPSVEGYQLKLVYAETNNPESRVVVSMQYGPSIGSRYPVVLTAQAGDLPSGLVRYDHVEQLNGHDVGFSTVAHHADTAVNGVLYQMDVLVTPDEESAPADRVRAAFLESITSHPD